MVATEVVAICGENTGAVGGVLVNTVLRSLFREAAQCLNAGLALKSRILLLCEDRKLSEDCK